jgi:hypothetical protein
LAPATLKKVIQTTKRFFTWLKMTYPREFHGLPQTWIEALQMPRHLQPAVNHVFVTLEEVRHIAALKIDERDLALQRDQAAAILLFLSGMRAGAFSTLPIKAVDLDQRTIMQLPTLGVRTKNGKSATTYLLDIPDLLAVMAKWDAFIRTRLPSTAMWFTPSISHWGSKHSQPIGLAQTATRPWPSGCALYFGSPVYPTSRRISFGMAMRCMPCNMPRRWPTTKPSA